MNEKIKNGVHTQWYKNGKKKFEGTFKNGKPVGLVTNWFDNGQKKEEMNFKNGRLNGLGTTWYKNGQKELEGSKSDLKP